MAQSEERYDWLGGDFEEEPQEEARRPAPAAREPERSFGEGGAAPEVRGASGLGVRPRARRRGRGRNPRALRNDPNRVQIGPYVRRGLKEEVERAFVDPEIFPGGDGSWSHLVDGLLERWLREIGYGPDGSENRGMDAEPGP